LKRLTKLSELLLLSTRVTQAGFSELRKAMPDCWVP
jgi:hypothetical protein